MADAQRCNTKSACTMPSICDAQMDGFCLRAYNYQRHQEYRKRLKERAEACDDGAPDQKDAE